MYTDQTGMQCFLEYCPKSTMVQECKGILHVESYMHLALNFYHKEFLKTETARQKVLSKF